MTINTWINAFLKPKETFAAEKTNASWGKAIINLVVAGVISAVFAFLAGLMTPGFNIGIAGIGLVVSIIAMPIMYIIFYLIGTLIVFIFAKLLGGQGGFIHLFYLISLVSVVYSLLVGIFNLIPFVGAFLAMILGLYMLYLEVLIVKESMQLSTGKAIIAIILPIILVIILVVILVVLVGVAIFGALGGMAANPTGYLGLP